MRYLRQPLEIPLVLFVVSALVGVWASYDPGVSWRKFALIVAAVTVFYLIVLLRSFPQFLLTFVWLFLFANAALAIYFATQHDYASDPGKFGIITSIGLFLNRITPQLPFDRTQPNILAGALEIALPLNVALIASQKLVLSEAEGHVPSVAEGAKGASPNSKSHFAFGFSLFTCSIIAFGLLMTSSRGAWLALGMAGVFALIIVLALDALKRYAMPLALIALLVIFIFVLRLGGVFLPTLENLLGAIPAGGSAISRIDLWVQTWHLIQDYYFTGSGLGVFPMVLSTYALLINVPFLTHAHNLFLQVWIEQGLLGIVALAWLIGEFYLWVWKRRADLSWLALGAVASATVMLLHGFVDVLLYSSRALPLMFIPMGLAIASNQTAVRREQWSNFGFRNSQVAIAVVLLAAFGLLLLAFWHPFAAMWYANLGSVSQTRVELGQYQFPDWLVEYVRHDSDLSQAQDYFYQARAFDNGNITANQRLGALALARGQYDAARDYIEAAYARDSANVATWQLLGDAYLAQGRLDDAYALWSRVSGAQSKLQTEAWVRYERNGDRERGESVRALAERIGSTDTRAK